jgi:hypothetical protein
MEQGEEHKSSAKEKMRHQLPSNKNSKPRAFFRLGLRARRRFIFSQATLAGTFLWFVSFGGKRNEQRIG